MYSFTINNDQFVHKKSQVALVGKNPPAGAGNIGAAGSIPGSGRSPGEGHGPHSSVLAWRVPWAEEPGGLQCMGLLESDTTERLHFHFSLSCVGEGHGNPLQCSCLENPRDGGAWQAPVHGVEKCLGHN